MMARKRRMASTSAAPPPKKAAGVVELPHELVLDILLRLPAKSLFRFRCVCKSWDVLFYDPDFLKQHYANCVHPKSAHRHRKLLMRTKMTAEHGEFQSFGVPAALCRDKSRVRGQYHRLPLPFKEHPNTSVVGCCNGVTCLEVRGWNGKEWEETTNIYFWNPLTSQCIKLPYTFSTPLYQNGNLFGFGFDDSTYEFKLVRIFDDDSKYGTHKNMAVEVYGMWEGQRKRISDFRCGCDPFSSSSSGGVCVNGALHWLASQQIKWQERWVIVALDLAKETFRPLLSLPDHLENDLVVCRYDTTLYCLGESLCCITRCKDRRTEVWIMKEYGVKESWIKLLTIPYNEQGLPSFPLCYSDINADQLLMIYQGQIVLYHLEYNYAIQNLGLCRFFRYDNEVRGCYTYIETLFTPSAMMRLRGQSSQQ